MYKCLMTTQREPKPPTSRKRNIKTRLALVIPLLLLLAVGALVFWGQHRRNTEALYYSGTIEATRADIAFLTQGRVLEVLVDEGQAVVGGQVLARLEADALGADLGAAEASVALAKADLARAEAALNLKKATLPMEVERAQAALKSLEYQYRELSGGFRPQEIEKARLAVAEAKSNLDQARRQKSRYDQLFAQQVVSESDTDAVDLRYQTALRRHQQAQQALDLAEEGFRKEAVQSAQARLSEGRSALALARSNLKQLALSEQEVAAARARVTVSESALTLARIRLAYTELKAPFAGILTSRNVEPGEVVTVGREVLSVSDLSRVDLKIFIDETEIGQIRPDQPVTVRIDTFPDKTYAGRVAYISPQSEFTPKIIQTHKERVKLVYLVKVSIANPQIELKPGMPADAWLH
jgi:HlyD family secretion protein